MKSIEDLFYDHIPDDGEYHRLEILVKVKGSMIIVENTTHGVFIDEKPVRINRE